MVRSPIHLPSSPASPRVKPSSPSTSRLGSSPSSQGSTGWTYGTPHSAPRGRSTLCKPLAFPPGDGQPPLRAATVAGSEDTRGRRAAPRQDLLADVWEGRRGRPLARAAALLPTKPVQTLLPANQPTLAQLASPPAGPLPVRPRPSGLLRGRPLGLPPSPSPQREPSPLQLSESPVFRGTEMDDLIGQFDEWELNGQAPPPRQLSPQLALPLPLPRPFQPRAKPQPG